MQEKERALDKALRALAGRARSEGEILEKLRRAGFAEETIAQTMAQLDRAGLLDDEAFAGAWRPPGRRARRPHRLRMSCAKRAWTPKRPRWRWKAWTGTRPSRPLRRWPRAICGGAAKTWSGGRWPPCSGAATATTTRGAHWRRRTPKRKKTNCSHVN